MVVRAGVALVLLLVTLHASGQAATYLVRPDGSGDFPTIQAALDAAASGDEILLGSGTFAGAGNGNLSFSGKALTVRSERNDPASCVIDCGRHTRGFRFVSGEGRGARVESVTITLGRVYGGYGGAVLCQQSSPTMVNCIFSDCHADWGGGVAIQGGGPVIQGCTFYFCGHLYGMYEAGGAIHAMGGDISVEDCLFDMNGAPKGGAIWSRHATLRISGCTFTSNMGDGAALWCEGGTVVYLGSSTVSFNGCDGQICLQESSLHASRTIIAFSFCSGPAVLCDAESIAHLSCCDIYGNPGGDWVGCLEGWEEINYNLCVDPMFCSLDDLDARLRSDSPCAAQNNPNCGQIGSLGVACEAPVPVQRSTWGRIKASSR